MSHKRKQSNITPSPFVEEHKGEKKRKIEVESPKLTTNFLNDLVQSIGTLIFYSDQDLFPDGFLEKVIAIYGVLLKRALTVNAIPQRVAELQIEWLQERMPDDNLLDDIIEMVQGAPDRKRREVMLQGIKGASSKEGKESALYNFSKDPLFDYQNLMAAIFDMSQEEHLPLESKNISYGWWATQSWWNALQNTFADSMPSRDFADFKRADTVSKASKKSTSIAVPLSFQLYTIFKSRIADFLQYARNFIQALITILQAGQLAIQESNNELTLTRFNDEILFLKNLDITEIHNQGYLYELIPDSILSNVVTLLTLISI